MYFMVCICLQFFPISIVGHYQYPDGVCGGPGVDGVYLGKFWFDSFWWHLLLWQTREAINENETGICLQSYTKLFVGSLTSEKNRIESEWKPKMLEKENNQCAEFQKKKLKCKMD